MCVRVAGRWTYLYRAVDSGGETIDFMLSPKRDAVAVKHVLQMALWRVGGRRPRVINVDGHPAYPQAIRELKTCGELSRRCRCRPSAYLNNVLEQDHRFLKRRMAASLWFRSVEGALRTIAGYEAMNMIRKGQIRWLALTQSSGHHSTHSSKSICDRTPMLVGCHAMFRVPSVPCLPSISITKSQRGDDRHIITPGVDKDL